MPERTQRLARAKTGSWLAACFVVGGSAAYGTRHPRTPTPFVELEEEPRCLTLVDRN